MPKKLVAPKPNDHADVHRKHVEEFLKLEEHKKPKSGIYSKSDEAKE